MTPILYTNITNKESGLSARTKLNTLGSNVSVMSSEIIDELGSIDTEIASHNDRLAVLEEKLGLICVGSNTALSSQAISSTPVKLQYMNTEFFKCGNISSNVIDNSITVLSSAPYILGGTLTISAENNEEVTVELYRNGAGTGIIGTAIGRAGKNVTMTWTGGLLLTSSDVLELYVSGTGSSIQIVNSSIVLEEKRC